MNNKVLTKELLDIKAKIMIQKIDKLYLICNMLFYSSKAREIKSLNVIKEQYYQMYNKLIETEQYEKYRKVEDIIIKEIAKVELNIDKYIYNTVQNCEKIIERNIHYIYESKNYQDFNNLEQEIEHIKILKQVLNLYSPYISKKEIERLHRNISILKFNVLWRNQVEHLIYGNKQKTTTLMQYDSQEEKVCFIKQLEEKKQLLRTANRIFPVKDEILEVEEEKILKDKNLLERLIIIDMEENSCYYINLVKAKIFNAHLCNIANDPFKEVLYLPELQYKDLDYWKYGMQSYIRNGLVTLKTNKVNFSLLRAVLKSIITDENISIVECENIYKKFGFKSRQIIVNDGQKCVEIIYHRVKDLKEFKENIEEKYIGKKKRKEGKYCKIDFEGLLYDYIDDLKGKTFYEIDEREAEIPNYIIDLLNKRKVKKSSKVKFYSKKQKICDEEENQQIIEDKIKREGITSNDIDIAIFLVKNKMNNGDNEYDRQEKENLLKELKEFKNINGQLTLEEARNLLSKIKFVYNNLDIRYRYNVWKLLPLEDMNTDSAEVYLPQIPKKYEIEPKEERNMYDCIRKKKSYHKYDLQPLWKEYQEDWRDLGIDVKKYGSHYGSKLEFEIFVNLDDISDLPIDYKKTKILTKEEIQEIMEREEGNERE